MGKKQPPPAARLCQKKRKYKARLLRAKLKEANKSLATQQWEVPTVDSLMKSDLARFVHYAASCTGYNGSIDSLVVNWLHPLMLQVRLKGKNDPDNTNWWQAMNGPFAAEYWEAACVEVETLEKMDAWSVVDRTDDMNVLPSTWAFKCKQHGHSSVSATQMD